MLMTPKQHANKLIKKYNTNDPFKIAKEKNIIVIFDDLEDIYGYYFSYKRVQFIHINNKLSENDQRFVCAHELGHSEQHPDKNTAYLSKHTLFSTDKLEIEANKFAVDLLVPDESIVDLVRDGYTLEQIALSFGIPKEFIGFKSFEEVL